MVQSALCHLRGKSKDELYQRGEEANEFGGYFIVGGLDKLIRMLFTQVSSSVSHSSVAQSSVSCSGGITLWP